MTEQAQTDAARAAEPRALRPVTQIEIDQRVFDLYDEYCHGRIDRREFLLQAAAVTVGGLAMAQALLPRYAQAQTISFTDQRIKATYVTYPSPGGTSGTMRGYLVQPSGQGPFPTVLVIHENRGLNPYIEDVARRAAVEGFLALAPDGLLPVGGYPGNDDDGRTLQAKPRPGQAAHRHAQQRAVSEGPRALDPASSALPASAGVAASSISWLPRSGADMHAGVPFYGAAAETAAVPSIKSCAADPVRGERRAHQFHVAGVRGGAEGRAAYGTRCTPIPAPSTASTTTPRPATTRRRPSSPGTALSRSSRSTWLESFRVAARWRSQPKHGGLAFPLAPETSCSLSRARTGWGRDLPGSRARGAREARRRA